MATIETTEAKIDALRASLEHTNTRIEAILRHFREETENKARRRETREFWLFLIFITLSLLWSIASVLHSR